MKKCWIVVLLALLLTGCGTQAAFETIGDPYEVPAMASAREIRVALPEDTTVLSMSSQETGTIYLCDDYTVTVQTLAGGDLESTLRNITGLGSDALTFIKTTEGSCDRYDLVWSCAGERGDQVGRATILDDGNYHYVLTAMTDADQTEAVSADWQRLFDSFWAV